MRNLPTILGAAAVIGLALGGPAEAGNMIGKPQYDSQMAERMCKVVRGGSDYEVKHSDSTQYIKYFYSKNNGFLPDAVTKIECNTGETDTFAHITFKQGDRIEFELWDKGEPGLTDKDIVLTSWSDRGKIKFDVERVFTTSNAIEAFNEVKTNVGRIVGNLEF
jgi:hypothetical protein